MVALRNKGKHAAHAASSAKSYFTVPEAENESEVLEELAPIETEETEEIVEDLVEEVDGDFDEEDADWEPVGKHSSAAVLAAKEAVEAEAEIAGEGDFEDFFTEETTEEPKQSFFKGLFGRFSKKSAEAEEDVTEPVESESDLDAPEDATPADETEIIESDEDLLEGDELPDAGESDESEDSEDSAAEEKEPLSEEELAERKQKRTRILKKAGLAVGIAAALAYGTGVGYFSTHYYPDTVYGDNDISRYNDIEVKEALDEQVADYTYTMSGYDFEFTQTREELGLTCDTDAVTQAMRGKVNQWLWPIELTKSHDLSDCVVVEYDQEGFDAALAEAIDEHNASAQPTVNAHVGFDEKLGSITVIPEAYGTTLEPEPTIASANEAVAALAQNQELTTDELVQPTILKDDEGLNQAAREADALSHVNMTLTMAGTEVVKVNGAAVCQWIDISEDNHATLNEGKIDDWIADLTDKLDTAGGTRYFTTPYGKEVEVSGGTYGWEVDGDALYDLIKNGIANNSTETVAVPCTQEEEVFYGIGDKDWGNRYIDVDLSDQWVRMYDDDGELIYESAVITGVPTPKRQTPEGVWTILEKQRNKVLTGEITASGKPEYETPVAYWMRVTWTGVGFHDATWQPWGGWYPSMYRNGYGSHGCLNLSYGNAADLYDICEEGDVVVIHY